ncbi:VWA domain-containing protein [Planctomycetota bacterium]|nr:VWA domain-containing protein [Planctomycetota bacterium]
MIDKEEHLRRWRLILGGNKADALKINLNADDSAMDKALEALYDSNRHGGLGPSAPNVPRWLGDIRKYFSKQVVQVMQRDALEKLDLTQMLTEPEMLEAIEPDVHMVATLLSMHGIIPEKTKETARQVVAQVVEELVRKLESPMQQAITGALNRAARNRRPKHNEIDWQRTIRANLKHYQPDYKTIIPETRIGYGRKQSALKKIILCVDQSGSMASSIVYSGIFGAVMASIPAVDTKLVVFDTAVVDLTEELHDPVEVLFSTQLGGGTDINRAVGYCQGLIESPQETIFVLISDLYEGGVAKDLLKRTHNMISSGVKFITLLALSDEGAPYYDRELGAKMSALGAPAFACTPEMFPELMAAAINQQDISQWAAERDILTT